MWFIVLCNFLQFVFVAILGQLASTYTKFTARHKRVILWGFVLASLSVFGLTSYLAYQQDQQTKDAIGNATGGDSFAYLQFNYFDSSSSVAKQVGIVKSGKYPLFNVAMRIADLDEAERGNTAAWNAYSTTLAEIDAPAVMLQGTWELRPRVYLRVFFIARNRQWHEDLILKYHSANYWAADTRVIEDRRGPGKVLFERLEFPNPEWRP